MPKKSVNVELTLARALTAPPHVVEKVLNPPKKATKSKASKPRKTPTRAKKIPPLLSVLKQQLCLIALTDSRIEEVESRFNLSSDAIIESANITREL